jgi:phytol kinase
MSPLFWLCFFLLLLLVLISITELMHRRLNWPVERSRKFLHVSGGIMCLFFPRFFPTHWWILPLAAISFLLLLFTYLRDLLPSVHKTSRVSVGSVLFPLPVYGCFLAAELAQQPVVYYLPVALLTFADTAAETGGHVWGHRTVQFFHGQKTLAGSLSFLVCALLINFLLLFFTSGWPFPKYVQATIAIALSATVAEGVTLKGWDNLTVPAIAVTLLLLWK